jgi:hypothetical protein
MKHRGSLNILSHFGNALVKCKGWLLHLRRTYEKTIHDAAYGSRMEAWYTQQGYISKHNLRPEYSLLLHSRYCLDHIPEHGANTLEDPRFLFARFHLVVQNCIQWWLSGPPSNWPKGTGTHSWPTVYRYTQCLGPIFLCNCVGEEPMFGFKMPELQILFYTCFWVAVTHIASKQQKAHKG